MKRVLTALIAGLTLLCMTGLANAVLITIGTATYGGSDYNLIWDDDNNGNWVVWLDYTNGEANWSAQNTWANGLDSSLTYNINSGYTVAWDDTAWRLPRTVDGTYVYTWGYDGTTTTGYNIASSEMGHLYYEELGNLGYWATDGTNPQPGWGLNNIGDFDHLFEYSYWSGSEDALELNEAWYFNMDNGPQYNQYKGCNIYGLAVRSGQVSAAPGPAPVPEPSTILLVATGLIGLVGFRKKFKK